MPQKDKGEEGGLEKIAKVLVKFLAKEMLWSILVLVIAAPLSFAFVYVFNEFTTIELKSELIAMMSGIPFFIVAYVVCVLGMYFTRMVVGSISTIAKG